MKVLLILFATLLLINCSSDSDDSGGSNPAPVVTNLIFSDPYIFNGVAFWDKNKNMIWDEGEPISGPSDEKGFASFNEVIPAGEIIGQHRAGTMDGFNYPGRLRGVSIGEGTVVLNPMTTLLANGFTEVEVVDLFANIGINLNDEDLFKDPMTDPLVLQAALTLTTGLLQNPKGFGLTPADTNVVAEGRVFRNNYSQGFLTNSAKIYEDVITQGDFASSLENLSKTGSSFLNYITKYGTVDFMDGTDVDRTEMDQALGAIEGQFEDSKTILEPIVLLSQVPASPTESAFVASVVKNTWFPPGNYDALGFRTLEANSRVVNNTIGNYSQGPLNLKVLFMKTTIGESNFVYNYLKDLEYVDSWDYQVFWNFNEDTKQLTLGESLTQKNGEPPENVQTREDLPVSSSDYLTTLVYRTIRKDVKEIDELTEIYRLIGDGEKILTHFGVNWGDDPKNPLPWRVDTSRTNNCLTGSVENRGVTADCSGEDVSVNYVMEREGLSVHSVEALTYADEEGLPPDITFSFIYKNRSLSEPNTENPVEYIISNIASVAGQMGVTSVCPVTDRCLQVTVGDSSRVPLDDSDGIDFFIGYETFPEDYKVWAVNSIEITEKGSGSINFFTNESSSFYKMGFLVVQLKQTGGIIPTPFEYIIVDIGTLEGTAVSFTKDWVEDGVIKFQYRDFDKIEIKQIPAGN